jgi:hypothetical protein
MVYTQLGLRDPSKVLTHFGAEGVCRRSNVGFDMLEVDTARLCTRVPVSYVADPSTPVAHPFSPSSSAALMWQPENCASSSRDLPWAAPSLDQAGRSWRELQSVGSVPFYRASQGGTQTYPPTAATHVLRVGYTTTSHREGTAATTTSYQAGEAAVNVPLTCPHPDLPPPCTTDDDCACQPSSPSCNYKCHSKGVCVRKQLTNGQGSRCYNHADCDSQTMCSGEGLCVPAHVEVRNELDGAHDAEFRLFTADCPAQGFHSTDMYGASPWGRVPDLLRRHGLCSHRDWVEYNMTLGRGKKQLLTTSTTSGTAGAAISTTTVVYDFDVNHYNDSWAFTRDRPGFNWREQSILHQQAHTCDRDYMHIEQFVSCSPRVTSTLSRPAAAGGALPGPWQPLLESQGIFGRIVRPYVRESMDQGTQQDTSVATLNGGRIRSRLGIVPHIASDLRYGFLGRRAGVPASARYTDFAFKKCNDVQWCSPQQFTVFGYPVLERRVWYTKMQVGLAAAGAQDASTEVERVRDLYDTFRCGAYGFIVMVGGVSRCFLDVAVVPIFRAMCFNGQNTLNLRTTCGTVPTKVDGWCDKFYASPFVPVTSAINRTRLLPSWTPDQEQARSGIVTTVNDYPSLFTPVQDSHPNDRHTTYLGAVRCGEALHAELVSGSTVSYTNVAQDAQSITSDTVGKLWAGRSLYWFSAYGLYEYPLSWFFKCWMLGGITPSEGYARCAAWSQQLEVDDTGFTSEIPLLSVWDYLLRVRGGIVLPTNLTAAAGGAWNSWKSMVDTVDLQSYFEDSDATGVQLRCSEDRVIPDAVYDHADFLQERMYDLQQKNTGQQSATWDPSLQTSLCSTSTTSTVADNWQRCTMPRISTNAPCSLLQQVRANFYRDANAVVLNSFLADPLPASPIMQRPGRIAVFKMSQLTLFDGKLVRVPPAVRDAQYIPARKTCSLIRVLDQQYQKFQKRAPINTPGGRALLQIMENDLRLTLESDSLQAYPYATLAFGGQPASVQSLFNVVYRNTSTLPQGAYIVNTGSPFVCPANRQCLKPYAQVPGLSNEGAVTWNLATSIQDAYQPFSAGATCGLLHERETCSFSMNCPITQLGIKAQSGSQFSSGVPASSSYVQNRGYLDWCAQRSDVTKTYECYSANTCSNLNTKVPECDGYTQDDFLSFVWGSYQGAMTAFLPIGVSLHAYRVDNKWENVWDISKHWPRGADCGYTYDGRAIDLTIPNSADWNRQSSVSLLRQYKPTHLQDNRFNCPQKARPPAPGQPDLVKAFHYHSMELKDPAYFWFRMLNHPAHMVNGGWYEALATCASRTDWKRDLTKEYFGATFRNDYNIDRFSDHCMRSMYVFYMGFKFTTPGQDFDAGPLSRCHERANQLRGYDEGDYSHIPARYYGPPYESSLYNNLDVYTSNIPARRRALLSAGGVPLSAKGVPLSAKGVPLSAKGVPLSAKGVPLSAGGALLNETDRITEAQSGGVEERQEEGHENRGRRLLATTEIPPSFDVMIWRDQQVRSRLASYFELPALRDPNLWVSPGFSYQEQIAQNFMRRDAGNVYDRSTDRRVGWWWEMPKFHGDPDDTNPTCPASLTGVSKCSLPDKGLHSYRLALHPDFTMDPSYCQERGKYAIPVLKGGTYKCKPEVLFQSLYCTGQHDCLVVPKRSFPRAYIPDYIADTILQEAEENVVQQQGGFGVDYARAVDFGMWALGNELMEQMDGRPYMDVAVQRMSLFEQESTAWNPQGAFREYDAGANSEYEETLPPIVGSSGLRCWGSYNNVTDYNQCDFDDVYKALVRSVQDNLMVNESVVVEHRRHLLFFATKNQLLNPAIPAWSRRARDLEETFLARVVNASHQCRQARRDISICSEVRQQGVDGVTLAVFNPWLGGAFNVFENNAVGSGAPDDGGCDTNLLEILDLPGGTINSEVIDPNCDGSLATCKPPSLLQTTTPDVCLQHAGLTPKYPIMPPTWHEHNLCTQKPRSNPAECEHQQGMLGGLKGARWNDLYAVKTLQVDPLLGGIYRNPMFLGASAPTSSLNSDGGEQEANAGAVAVQLDEIAGHHIVYAVRGEPGKLSIHNVPIRSLYVVETDGSLTFQNVQQQGQSNAPDSVNWLNVLGSSTLEDQVFLQHMRPATWMPQEATSTSGAAATGLAWACPLHTMLLWSGQSATLLPAIPHPLRAGRLYGAFMQSFLVPESLPVHPTTKTQFLQASRLDVQYWTTNGFCIYNSDAALAPFSETCSLANVAGSVLDQEFRNYTTALLDRCFDQVDWPYMSTMQFRDGTSFSSPTSEANDRPCAVLDRMPMTQHRLRLTAPFASTGTSTSSRGGACHMGRAAMNPKSATPVTTRGPFFASPVPTGPGGEEEDCWMVNETSRNVTLYCPAAGSSSTTSGGQGGVYKVLPKRSIATPHDLARSGMRSSRRVCSAGAPAAQRCDAPPAFAGSPTGPTWRVPEVAYGTSFRWEMARTMAGDLRSLLCAADSQCSTTAASTGGRSAPLTSLNATAWTLSHFLHDFFHRPQNLLNASSGVSNPTNASFGNSSFRTLQQVLDDHAAAFDPHADGVLWTGRPWVMCKDAQGRNNCTGTLGKADWVRNRGTQCKARIVEHLRNHPEDGVVRLDLCNLNSDMDLLCRKIMDSITQVANANCLATAASSAQQQGAAAQTPACMPHAFFYTPSAYSSSNQQFVRDTVREFYERFGVTCPVEDAQTALLVTQNEALKKRCGSVPLEAFKQAIYMCRSVVDDLMEVLFDIYNIQLDLLSLLASITSAHQQQIVQDLVFWFKELIHDAAEAIIQAAQVLFRLVMDISPLGKALAKIIQLICQILRWWLNNIWKSFLCKLYEAILPPIIDVANAFLTYLYYYLRAIELFLNFFGANLNFSGGIWNLIEGLKEAKYQIQNGALQCHANYEFTCEWSSADDVQPSGALPVATRCWAGFQPDAGDATALSCSRADTCNTEDLTSTVVCDACPVNPLSDEFLSFACSPATKKCTCGVQRFERTQCSSHAECYSYMQGASCMMVSSIFATTYSTVPCSQCVTQQVFFPFPLSQHSPSPLLSTHVQTFSQVCIVTAPDQPGYCACPIQQNFEVQSCTAASVGDLVTPADSTALCNVMSSSGAAVLSTYNADVSWDNLAITSCALLDSALTFCYNVNGIPSVVGFGLLQTFRRRRRRHLLAVEGLSGSQNGSQDEWDEVTRDEWEEVTRHEWDEVTRDEVTRDEWEEDEWEQVWEAEGNRQTPAASLAVANDMLRRADWTAASPLCRDLVHAYRERGERRHCRRHSHVCFFVLFSRTLERPPVYRGGHSTGNFLRFVVH